jgi:hypothetical protein
LGGDLERELNRIFGDVGGMIVNASEDDIARIRNEIAFIQSEMAELEAQGLQQTPIFSGFAEDLALARQDLAALTGDFDNLGSLAEGLVSPNLLQRVFDLRGALEEAVEEQRFADAVVQIDRLRSAIGAAAEQSGGMTPPLEEALNALTRAQAVVQEFANDMGQLAEESGKASQESMTLEAALARIGGSDISGGAGDLDCQSPWPCRERGGTVYQHLVAGCKFRWRANNRCCWL